MSNPSDHDPASELFERAADAVVFGDLETLRSLLDQEPALVHARSARRHRATLLHYCAANGTEDPRQRTPDNAPAIARFLLERGADPTAECPMYGCGRCWVCCLRARSRMLRASTASWSAVECAWTRATCSRLSCTHDRARSMRSPKRALQSTTCCLRQRPIGQTCSKRCSLRALTSTRASQTTGLRCMLQPSTAEPERRSCYNGRVETAELIERSRRA